VTYVFFGDEKERKKNVETAKKKRGKNMKRRTRNEKRRKKNMYEFQK